MRTTATAFAPASVGNVAVGFDVLGHSFQTIGDKVTARRIAEPGVRISSISGTVADLPREPEKNTAGMAVLSMARDLKLDVRPLQGGLQSQAVRAVSARYRDEFGKKRHLRFVVKSVLGPARREAPIYEALTTSNSRVFAHVRSHDHDTVLCVHNLARSAQAVELDLSRFEGHTPVEMTGGTPFPAIGTLPYLLTFGPRGFYWFRLLGEAPDA